MYKLNKYLTFDEKFNRWTTFKMPKTGLNVYFHFFLGKNFFDLFSYDKLLAKWANAIALCTAVPKLWWHVCLPHMG